MDWIDFIIKSSEAIPGALVGSAVGAGFAMWFTIRINRQENRRQLTQKFIDELLSVEFIHHRIALGHLLDVFNDHPEMVEKFAAGFWFPGGGDEYLGETHNGLNYHQHFEVSKGWVRRMAHAIRNDRVDKDDITAALSDPYKWMNAVLSVVATEVDRQIRIAESNGIKIGAIGWIDDVKKLESELNM